MNKIKFGLCGLILLFSLNLLGQEKYIITEKITWSEPITIKSDIKPTVLLNFDCMGDIDPETNLAKAFKSIILPSNVDPKTVSIQITNKKFIWPTPLELITFNKIVSDTTINTEFNVSQSGINYYVDFSFTPVKKESNTSTFQKLSEFDIEISYTNISENNLKSTNSEDDYAENSVLNEGTWSKIQVSETGIHKISYSTLQDWGFSEPSNIGIYGNGGDLLPQANDDYRYDDLVENAILHYNEAIYFFAEGPVTWDYDESEGMFLHTKHPYSNYAYYFICEKESDTNEIVDSDLQTENYNEETSVFIDYDYHETNTYNLILSGQKWLGEKFDYYGDLELNFDFNFSNITTDTYVNSYIAVTSRRTDGSSTFSAAYNDNTIGSVTLSSVTSGDNTGYYAREGDISSSFEPSDDDITIDILYNDNGTSAVGYLDYICVNAYRDLTFIENQLYFRNIDLVDNNNTVKYNLSECPSDVIIWDVSDPLVPLNINTTTSSSTLSFNYEASELKNFVAFDPSGSFSTPELVGSVENQNLHGLDNKDYLIVCHPDFEEQAIRLGELHNAYSGTSYCVVSTDQIYNEFSSGKPDVTAIRNFAKMFYDRAGDDDYLKPQNMLLFGDGSYDNRPDIDDNTDKVITFQSENSVHQTNSYVTDDYFGFLDDSEGDDITSDKLDIGIGRFPVNTTDEATEAVDKTDYYMNNQTLDSWKSQLTYVADDGDSNIHMEQANTIADDINSLYPQFNIDKIFFDAYEKEVDATSSSYPDVEEAIYNAINDGTLVFNYTGHGGTSALAEEEVITETHIESWSNINKLPIFITATCEFSRFDDKDETSAGEMIFLSNTGGGIVLYTTTRIVYSSLNYTLNSSIFENIFETDENGLPLTLGEIMKLAKINSGSSVNKLNFTLLGDPALQPLYPTLFANTLTLNNTPIDEPLDTLTALSNNTISGDITDALENDQNEFNGEVYVTIYDKKTTVSTLDNNGDGVFEYETYENTIFNGISSVTNGEFESQFTVPLDIRYNYDNGKISYHAFSDDDDEAFGAFDEFIIGGIDSDIDDDSEGPQIEVYLNDRTFENGDKVCPSPLLLVDISDENGINTSGIGIGHDITCTIIDEDSSDPTILNDYFEAELDSYQEGSISYQLDEFENGEHELTIKAWDTFNNSSESTITFTTSNNTSIETTNIKCYPNPINIGESTYIYFEHDEPNATLTLELNIYTISGQLIYSEEYDVVSLGSTISPIEWNDADNPGIYVYHIKINSESGRNGEISGKILVVQ